MPKPTAELKQLPWNPSRKEIYEMYTGISRRKLKLEMDLIVKENRKHHPPETKNSGGLYHSEMLELIRVIDLPEGYAHYPGWED